MPASLFAGFKNILPCRLEKESLNVKLFILACNAANIAQVATILHHVCVVSSISRFNPLVWVILNQQGGKSEKKVVSVDDLIEKTLKNNQIF